MKKVIKRNLALNVKYTCIDKKYIPLSEGIGCTCDNCGKLIANIATVKSVNGTFDIGFDCLETVLLNNSLLEGFDVSEYDRVKKMIPKIIKAAKSIKEASEKTPTITGIVFDAKRINENYFTFFWQINKKTSRSNDYLKIKDMDFDFLIETLRNIFPKLSIIVQ